MSVLYQVREAVFAYPIRNVFAGLSLTLEAGHFYGIIGPNGCGKTTLIDLLCGHRCPQSGLIHYKGRPLKDYGPKALARQVALVPQSFSSSFGFTCKEVVTMGRYPHIPRFNRPGPEDVERVRSVMEQTDLMPLRHRSMTELSGGERQRVIFARALVQDTPVLLLDEATANLDMRHAIALLNLAADRVNEQTAVVAVMQDINLAALFCDYLVCMTEGRVAFHGPTGQVLNAHMLSQVFHVDARVQYNAHSAALQVAVKR